MAGGNMPDPYTFPPGDVRPDDPQHPAAAPLGGEQGSNEHGEGSEFIPAVAASAQGGGVTMATPGSLPNEDPELAKDVVVNAPTITSFTPTTGTTGTAITVTGTNLDRAETIKVNGVVATRVSRAATTVVFNIGAGSSTGKIEIFTNHGSVQSAGNLTVT